MIASELLRRIQNVIEDHGGDTPVVMLFHDGSFVTPITHDCLIVRNRDVDKPNERGQTPTIILRPM